MGRCINLSIQRPFSYVLWLLTSEDNVSLDTALAYPFTAPGKLPTWPAARNLSLFLVAVAVYGCSSVRMCVHGSLCSLENWHRAGNLSIKNHLHTLWLVINLRLLHQSTGHGRMHTFKSHHAGLLASLCGTVETVPQPFLVNTAPLALQGSELSEFLATGWCACVFICIYTLVCIHV